MLRRHCCHWRLGVWACKCPSLLRETCRHKGSVVFYFLERMKTTLSKEGTHASCQTWGGAPRAARAPGAAPCPAPARARDAGLAARDVATWQPG